MVKKITSNSEYQRQLEVEKIGGNIHSADFKQAHREAKRGLSLLSVLSFFGLVATND